MAKWTLDVWSRQSAAKVLGVIVVLLPLLGFIVAIVLPMLLRNLGYGGVRH